MKTKIKKIKIASMSIALASLPLYYIGHWNITNELMALPLALFSGICIVVGIWLYEKQTPQGIYPGSFYYSEDAKKIRKSLGIVSVCMCLCLVGMGQKMKTVVDHDQEHYKHVNADGTVWYDFSLHYIVVPDEQQEWKSIIDTTSGYYFSKHYVDSLKCLISLYKEFVDAILDPKFRELPYLGNAHEVKDQTEDMIYTQHGQSQIIIHDNRHIYIDTSAITPTHKKYKWYLPEDQEEWRDTPQPTYTISKGDTLILRGTPNDSDTTLGWHFSRDSSVLMRYNADTTIDIKVTPMTIKVGKIIINKSATVPLNYPSIPYYKEGWVPFQRPVDIITPGPMNPFEIHAVLEANPPFSHLSSQLK